MYEKIKTWTLRFPTKEKKSLIWRRHCSIGQSCCNMTSKRSIGWFLEKFFGHEVFLPERLLKPIKSLYFLSFVFSVLFARFHFKIIQKSLYWTVPCERSVRSNIQFSRLKIRPVPCEHSLIMYPVPNARKHSHSILNAGKYMYRLPNAGKYKLCLPRAGNYIHCVPSGGKYMHSLQNTEIYMHCQPSVCQTKTCTQC